MKPEVWKVLCDKNEKILNRENESFTTQSIQSEPRRDCCRIKLVHLREKVETEKCNRWDTHTVVNKPNCIWVRWWKRNLTSKQFSDTLSGLAVIRGLKQEFRFRHLMAEYLATHVRAEWTSLAASSWLSVRLQMMASGILTGVVVLSFIGRKFGWTEVSSLIFNPRLGMFSDFSDFVKHAFGLWSRDHSNENG